MNKRRLYDKINLINIEKADENMKINDKINEFVKRVVLAWDPDYTKATPREAADMALAEEEFAKGDTVSHEDIDWD